MNKIIRNKLTKEVQDLYTENWKTLLKDILKNLNNWKNSLCLWFARLNIVKTAFFFFFLDTVQTLYRALEQSVNLIYRLSTIPIRIPDDFFMEINKVILKFIENFKGPWWIAKYIYRERQEEQNRKIHIPWFQNLVQSYSNQDNHGTGTQIDT